MYKTEETIDRDTGAKGGRSARGGVGFKEDKTPGARSFIVKEQEVEAFGEEVAMGTAEEFNKSRIGKFIEKGLGVHFINEQSRNLYEQFGGVKTNESAGFDLLAVEDTKIWAGETNLVNLGLVVKIPVGFHMIIMPRSSTFKKFRLTQTNGVGLIDQDYCGPDDVLGFLAHWDGVVTKNMEGFEMISRNQDDGLTRSVQNGFILPKGTRLCQYVIRETLFAPRYEYDPSDQKSRGGWGSTGN